MQVTGTLFNYYFVCHRKLWLFANGINMEHTSDLVFEGTVIHESSYAQRASRFKEIELPGIKIDFYDAKQKVVHEIKKSRKEHESHIWQLKYYIYKLEQAGIDGAMGILEYPKERKTEEIYMSQLDKERIQEIEVEIQALLNTQPCPATINHSKCKKCAYHDFCYATETDEK
jgi:CRISPR-associated exonuclease Cas4